MKQCDQTELIKRALALIESHQADMADASSRVPLEHYTSPDHLERERRALFRKFPLVVGFSSQVANAGDFFTHDYSEIPILVNRDQSGKLNAFVNTCRHRGARVQVERSGTGATGFNCPYHGWSYDDQGKLRGTPCHVGFPELDKEQNGLVRLPVAERYGMVFVTLTPDEEFDIDDYLGPLAEDLGSFGLDDYVLAEERTYHRNMNWKLQVDAALETYHFGYLHAKTSSAGYFSNIALYDYAEPHARITVPKRTISKLSGTEPQTGNLLEHASLLYTIFPNTAVFLAGGNAHVLCTFPKTIDSSILHGGMLVRPGAQNERVREFYHDHYWKVQEEDMVIAESVQSTLRSGVNTSLLFGRHEMLGGKFHQAIDDALAGKLIPRRALLV
jgi:phenylpropionate dioxygenase-like ring-hydroxylating dioxygenase large terminal subunit